MSTVSKSFTAVSAGTGLRPRKGESFSYAVSGTFSATWILERSKDGWQTSEQILTGTAAASGTLVSPDDQSIYRFRCSAFTSGTMVTALTDISDTLQEIKNLDGLSVLKVTETGLETQALTASSGIITGAAQVGSLTASNGDTLHAYVDKAISSAQLLALNATFQTLVAAPGANKALVFEKAHFFFDYNSVAYDGIAANEDLLIRYQNTSGFVVANIEATGFLDQTTDQYRIAHPATGAAAVLPSFTPVINQPLVLHMSTGEIATGNSPLGVRVYYSVVDFSTLLAA